jgi:tetratricopeptide (TPR) repeat protein
MARDDWFRKTTWTDADEDAFFTRLRRSRSVFHKAQYLRLQAHSLAGTEQEPLVRAALALLDRLFTEFPDLSQLAQAHLLAAHCYEQLGDITSAIDHFRLSQDARSKYPNLDAGTDLEFPWFIVKHDISSLYDEALATLETAHLAFPVQIFKASAVRAFVASSRGDSQAATRHANEALEAAGLEKSQFRYHRTLGIVGAEYRPVIERLSDIAAA